MLKIKTMTLLVVFSLFLISSYDTVHKKNNLSIVFKPTFNGNNISCNSQILHSEKQWQYNQLQFFLSDFQFKNNVGIWENIPLKKTAFQTNNSVLLGEFCDKSNIQKSTLNPQKDTANWQILFTEKANITSLTNKNHIRFTLGLPFEVNHLNPLTQESPLNVPNMFWSWQGGHKFLRLEMTSAHDNWLFHLGSVGCITASPLRAPAQECHYPNRYTFELPLPTEQNFIAFELASLLTEIRLSEHTHCQSDPDNAACQTLFVNLDAKKNKSVFRLNQKALDHE